MNKEFDGFDEMVEALEENEDMVECKECFDLVPKVDCERAEVGYICPTCKGLRTAPAQARFVDPYDSYTQDFPEVTEYDPDSVVEYEKEPGLGDALSDLIRDEYEAIEGYEVADETIQHADIDEEDKDEILDTLDHIKEEEEEHIDELKELCPECDKEVEEPFDKAPATDSAVCEKLDIDLSNCIDSSDMEIWGVEPAGKDTYKAVLLKRFENVSFRGNDEIDKVESEMFDLGGLFVFYFGKNGMPKLDRWDPELLRSLSNCEIIFEDDRYDQACERTLNRSTSQVEELKEATDDKEAAEEDEVEEIPEEDIPEDEAEDKAEDSEENENEEVSDLDSAYEAALEIANESGVGQVFGYAKKDTEEFVAIEPFEVDDPDAVEDDLMAVYDDVAYAYVVYPEKNLEEALFEDADNSSSNEELVEVPQAEFEDTTASLKSTANSMQNVTSAMREEYHRYANPAELKAMEDIEELAANAVIKVSDDIATWGYEATEIATQSWMCQEDETCLQYMLEFKDLDPDEIDDLASQLEMQLENEISVYKPVPEIRGISANVVLPDYDLADEGDEAKGITKASLLFYVAFARNLY